LVVELLSLDKSFGIELFQQIVKATAHVVDDCFGKFVLPRVRGAVSIMGTVVDFANGSAARKTAQCESAWNKCWTPIGGQTARRFTVKEMVGAVQHLPVPRSSEYPTFRRDHWAVGRPSVRVTCVPLNRCGQPVGESSHVSCRP